MKYEEFTKIKNQIAEAVNQEIPAGSCRKRIKAINERLADAIKEKHLERNENSKYVIFTHSENLGNKKYPDIVRIVYCLEIGRETEKSFIFNGMLISKESFSTGPIGYAE